MSRKLEIPLVRDKVYDLLKEDILKGKIRLGQKLNLREIAEELGISTAPVRDALLTLSSEGLVKVVPRVGFFVTTVNENYINEIIESREMLEVFCLDRYFERIREKLEGSDVLEKAKVVRRSGDRKAFDESDKRLHMTIVESSNNEIIIGFYRKLWDRIDLVRHLNRRYLESNEEHIRIVLSILEGDKDSALHHLKEHLRNVQEDTIRNLKSGE